MNFVEAILIAIVEGLTEYLPVSSTGHMILTEWLLKLNNDNFLKLFTVAIQLGAILAVVFLYFKKFFQSFQFYIKLLIAFIPSAIFGLVFSEDIDALLESPLTVGITLFLGGLVLLKTDKWFENNKTEEMELNYKTAFQIGCFQIISLIPGVSRSGSTIFGGLFKGLSKKQASEFSFFLAVPTMLAATGYKLLKYYKGGQTLDSHQINLLLVGNLVAFLVAILAIKTFIGILQKYGFRPFGWYRIVVGAVILIVLALK